MPGDHRRPLSEIAAAADRHTALPRDRHEAFGDNAGRHPLTKKFRHSTRLSQFDELPLPLVRGPAELVRLGVPTTVLDLVPADVPPCRLIAVGEQRRAADADAVWRSGPGEDACLASLVDLRRLQPRLIRGGRHPAGPGPPSRRQASVSRHGGYSPLGQSWADALWGQMPRNCSRARCSRRRTWVAVICSDLAVSA